jgi:hypothetical protein
MRTLDGDLKNRGRAHCCNCRNPQQKKEYIRSVGSTLDNFILMVRYAKKDMLVN